LRLISDEQAETILSSFEGLGIALRPVTWQHLLPLALRFDRSAYDAAYLIAGDSWMYHAVREHLDWVQWLGDYSPAGLWAAVGPD
jgi:hypothetical protein